MNFNKTDWTCLQIQLDALAQRFMEGPLVAPSLTFCAKLVNVSLEVSSHKLEALWTILVDYNMMVTFQYCGLQINHIVAKYYLDIYAKVFAINHIVAKDCLNIYASTFYRN